MNTLPWLAKDDVDGKMAITMTDATRKKIMTVIIMIMTMMTVLGKWQ